MYILLGYNKNDVCRVLDTKDMVISEVNKQDLINTIKVYKCKVLGVSSNGELHPKHDDMESDIIKAPNGAVGYLGAFTRAVIVMPYTDTVFVINDVSFVHNNFYALPGEVDMGVVDGIPCAYYRMDADRIRGREYYYEYLIVGKKLYRSGWKDEVYTNVFKNASHTVGSAIQDKRVFYGKELYMGGALVCS